MSQWHGGKGSKPRPFSVDKKKFDDNWDRIFGKKDQEKEKKDLTNEKKICIIDNINWNLGNILYK